MSNFTLSKRRVKVLPETVNSAGGSTFSINADYRNILRIFRMIADPDINDRHRGYLLAKWFFEDIAVVPPDYGQIFERFITNGEEHTSSNGKQVFCYEFDAEEIYSSFLAVYGIDLLDAEYMHWYKFRALLSGLFMCENPLSKKIELRTLDISKCENKTEARKAKEAVQIPQKVGYSDAKLQEKILQALKNGESVTQLLQGCDG
ncbi:MAG: Gp15 family bacteriophage protein [Bacillota bacterium]|nr:Gp15 family bacteriophage protein [Bacillota bacterium]